VQQSCKFGEIAPSGLQDITFTNCGTKNAAKLLLHNTNNIANGDDTKYNTYIHLSGRQIQTENTGGAHRQVLISCHVNCGSLIVYSVHITFCGKMLAANDTKRLTFSHPECDLHQELNCANIHKLIL